MPDKILLVDDDDILRNEFKDCFAEYDLIEASNAAQALSLLSKPNEIDLIMLDVRMPGMDGLTALDKIKQIAPGKGVIILTGYASKDVVIKALRGQADNFIEKPFDIKKTREIMEKVIDARSGLRELGDMNSGDKIEHVKRFVLRNSHKKVRLAEAASAVCLSAKYLSRIFRERTGMGFNAYRLKVKISEARTLLKTTGWNVDQISDNLGYANTESLIRLFKKVTGLTPSQYRKNEVKAKAKAGLKTSAGKKLKKTREKALNQAVVSGSQIPQSHAARQKRQL